MRKDIQTRQEQMRERMRKQQPADSQKPRNPRAAYLPVDYSIAVEYGSEVQALFYVPRFNGVYLLTEDGKFYIGQSNDIHARFSQHRIKPISCHFEDPRGVLLATVPERLDKTWSENAHVRLRAEARFIAAALSLGIPLTNQMSEDKRRRLASTFPDTECEQARIQKALEILCQFVSKNGDTCISCASSALKNQ